MEPEQIISLVNTAPLAALVVAVFALGRAVGAGIKISVQVALSEEDRALLRRR